MVRTFKQRIAEGTRAAGYDLIGLAGRGLQYGAIALAGATASTHIAREQAEQAGPITRFLGEIAPTNYTSFAEDVALSAHKKISNTDLRTAYEIAAGIYALGLITRMTARHRKNRVREGDIVGRIGLDEQEQPRLQYRKAA